MRPSVEGAAGAAPSPAAAAAAAAAAGRRAGGAARGAARGGAARGARGGAAGAPQLLKARARPRADVPAPGGARRLALIGPRSGGKICGLRPAPRPHTPPAMTRWVLVNAATPLNAIGGPARRDLAMGRDRRGRRRRAGGRRGRRLQVRAPCRAAAGAAGSATPVRAGYTPEPRPLCGAARWCGGRRQAAGGRAGGHGMAWQERAGGQAVRRGLRPAAAVRPRRRPARGAAAGPRARGARRACVGMALAAVQDRRQVGRAGLWRPFERAGSTPRPPPPPPPPGARPPSGPRRSRERLRRAAGPGATAAAAAAAAATAWRGSSMRQWAASPVQCLNAGRAASLQGGRGGCRAVRAIAGVGGGVVSCRAKACA
jgi:hypothetical protein